jgi:hypothetical protein
MPTTDTTAEAVEELQQPEHLAAFLAAAGVALDLTEGGTPPEEMGRGARSYTARLTGPNGAECTVPYFTGSGWPQDPTAADVVHTLARTLPRPGETFEEYADEYGINTDSRRELAEFEQARRLGRRFSIFLSMAGIDRDALDAATEDY